MKDFGEKLYAEFKKLDSRPDWNDYKYKEVWNKTADFSLEVLQIFVSKNSKVFNNKDFFNVLKSNAVYNDLWKLPNYEYVHMNSSGQKKFDIFVKTALLEIE